MTVRTKFVENSLGIFQAKCLKVLAYLRNSSNREFGQTSYFRVDLRVTFLIFESVRTYFLDQLSGKVKLSLMLICRMDLIVSEQLKVINEQKEIALKRTIQVAGLKG
jgi:hypothetical protein